MSYVRLDCPWCKHNFAGPIGFTGACPCCDRCVEVVPPLKVFVRASFHGSELVIAVNNNEHVLESTTSVTDTDRLAFRCESIRKELGL